MEKIKTLFDREGHGGVIDRPAEGMEGWFDGAEVTASEKLDGTNVRLTVRKGQLMRLEKRRNPSKVQKKQRIVDPWYIDAVEGDPADKYIWDAACNTSLEGVPDGEWSGEAIGPKIQGNPLDLSVRYVVLFSLGRATEVDAPTSYDELREWLPKQKSYMVASPRPIEGVVWVRGDGAMAKIKVKDFKGVE